ncbi:MAG: 6-hydroxymethylpterin diphosphokinase MptE-like protein [Opitutae bacterium]
MTGFGDGSHIRQFIQNTAGGNYLFVTEKDPCLLKETFSRIDCSDFLANDRFLLGTGDCDDAFFKDLQAAAMLGLSDVSGLIFSPLHSVDEGYYDNSRNEMIRQYLVVRPLIEVNLRTGINLQENTFENMPHMATSPDVGELANQFEDLPFILVGAGPSLDDSIDFLKSIQDKAIIVTSNSPYRKLINSGIRPHLVVTADPLAPTLAGFRNVFLDDVPLACPFSAYPEIVRRFSGRILSWVTFSPIVDTLKEYMGEKPGTPIMEQGTVSGCVLDLSRLLGCKKVIFVGQDMCVRADGKYYTDDSAYADSGSHFTNKMDGHKLPGNTLPEVVVEGRLFVYLKTFEKFISENPNVTYKNIAKTGVKIKGADYIEYSAALDWIGSDSSSSIFSNKITSLLAHKKKEPCLVDAFSGLRNFLEKLLHETLSLAIKTELLPAKYSGTNYSENKAITELLRLSGRVNKLVDENPQFWHILLDGKTKAELAIYKRVIRDINFANKNWALIQKNKEYFWALAEGCHWLLNLMDEKIYPKEARNQLESAFS